MLRQPSKSFNSSSSKTPELFWIEPLETVDRLGARVLRHPTSIFTASLLSLFEGSLSQRSRYTKVRGSKKQSCYIIISEVLCSRTTHKVMGSFAASMGTLFPLSGENQIFHLARSRRPETITQVPLELSHGQMRLMIRKSKRNCSPFRFSDH